MADPVLSGDGTFFWGAERFEWPEPVGHRGGAWQMSWDVDKRGVRPEITEVKVRVEVYDDDGNLVPLGDTHDADDLNEEYLLRLGGGRRYKLHLRHKGQSLPNSRVRVDLVGRAEPGALPGQRRREASPEREAPPPEPSGPSMEDVLRAGREAIESSLGETEPNERFILAMKLRALEDNASFTRLHLEASKELLKAQFAAQTNGHGPLLEALRAELAEMKSEMRAERDENAKLRAELEASKMASLRHELVAKGAIPADTPQGAGGSDLLALALPYLMNLAEPLLRQKIAAMAGPAAVAAVG